MSVIARIKNVNESATSAQISEMIKATSRELDSTEAELLRLEVERKPVLLSGDDAAAEKHDAQIGSTRRQVDRLRAMLDELEARRRAALAREEVEALNRLRAQAEAAVADVVRRLGAEYAPAAEMIAAFVEDWVAAIKLRDAANEALRAAKRVDFIRSPEEIARKAPDREEPEREVTEMVGGPTQWVQDPTTGQMRPTGPNAHERPRAVKRIIPASFIVGDRLPPLAENLALPAAQPGHAPFWPKR